MSKASVMLNLFQHPFRQLLDPARKWTLKRVQGDELGGSS